MWGSFSMLLTLDNNFKFTTWTGAKIIKTFWHIFTRLNSQFHQNTQHNTKRLTYRIMNVQNYAKEEWI